MFRLIARSFIFLLSLHSASYAQDKDFGSWFDFSLSHRFNSRWSVGIGEQVRFNRNLATVDLFFTEAGVQYTLRKDLKASFNYRFIRKNELDFWTTRHGFFADLAWKKKWKPVVLTLRGRLQARMEDFSSLQETFGPDWFGRMKVQFTYEAKGKTAPFLSAESFFLLKSSSDPYLNGSLTRMRYEAGLQHELNKRSSIKLSYMIQNNRIDELQEFVVCAGYSFGF